MDVRIARYHNIFGPEGSWNSETADVHFLATHGLAPDRYCRVDVGDVDRLVNELQATKCAVIKKCESRVVPTAADLSGCKLAIQSQGNGHWAAGALTGA